IPARTSPTARPTRQLKMDEAANVSTHGVNNSAEHGAAAGPGSDASAPAGAAPHSLRGPAPLGVAGTPAKTSNDPPRLRAGSRDWIIAVECLQDAVIVHPYGQRIGTTALAPAGAENALQRAVRQLIERRQATVRPGEPPYRPQIRFLVRKDGLHAYYLAYPALEALRIPMTRQNLEEESRD